MTAADVYAPLEVAVRGQAVHIVNVSEGEDETASRGGPGVFGWDIPRVVETIERSKAAGALVVVIAHCGLEYVPFAPPYVVEAFRAFADAGAAAVIGHHPHVPQGVEWRGRTPIVYSLGNFVFYQPTNLHYRKIGYFVTLRCETGRVSHVDLHPYRIEDEGLRMLDEREGATFLTLMTQVSTPYRTPDGHLKAWDAYLDYYGTAGFAAEVTGILEKMSTEPEKAAAMFRNRISTAQHLELWRTHLSRVMAGGRPRHTKAARALVGEYFTRTV
jgi:poly-gamma-glutamate synthesis protein (capsule biosynthesis protein)